MNKRALAASLVWAAAVSATFPVTAEAMANFDLRKKVIGVSGIMGITNIDAEVTRGEFASMLVNASSYRSTVSAGSNTAVFADVPMDHEYASSIRIVAEQGWMTGFLGGDFKPDQAVTLQEAIRGVLGLLGYGNSDFTGDQTGARLAKYEFLELNVNIDKESSEILIREDCVNLFYNLLKADTKTGSMFGASLGCELTSDGEINPLTMVDNSLKGPKVVRSKSRLSDYLPFALSKANVYLDGDPVSNSSGRLADALQNGDGVLVYYHPLSKTVWLYTIGMENETGRSAVHGEITNVVYNSTNLMTPSAVILDDGITYELEGTQMQFAFSTYGDLRVGDTVTLVYTVSMNNNQEEVRTVLDYIDD